MWIFPISLKHKFLLLYIILNHMMYENFVHIGGWFISIKYVLAFISLYLCYSSTICSTTCMHLYGHKNQPQIYSFIYDVPQDEEEGGVDKYQKTKYYNKNEWTQTTSLLKIGHFLNNWIKIGIVKEKLKNLAILSFQLVKAESAGWISFWDSMKNTICSFKNGVFFRCVFLFTKWYFLCFILGILCISEGEIGWCSVLVASHYYLDELWGFLYKVYDVRVD